MIAVTSLLYNVYLLGLRNGDKSTVQNAIESENFSCDNLREIDDIWNNYFGENFDFSTLRNEFIKTYFQHLYTLDIPNPDKINSFSDILPANPKERALAQRINIISSLYPNKSDDKLALELLRQFYYIDALGMSEEVFDTREQPIYIPAILPKETDSAIERFFAINSTLEVCKIVPDHLEIKKNIVDKISAWYVDCMEDLSSLPRNEKSLRFVKLRWEEHGQPNGSPTDSHCGSQHPWHSEFYGEI